MIRRRANDVPEAGQANASGHGGDSGLNRPRKDSPQSEWPAFDTVTSNCPASVGSALGFRELTSPNETPAPQSLSAPEMPLLAISGVPRVNPADDLLSALIDGADLAAEYADGRVVLHVTLSAAVFEALCAHGAAKEDMEADAPPFHPVPPGTGSDRSVDGRRGFERVCQRTTRPLTSRSLRLVSNKLLHCS